jgi:hypothetical protein
MPVVGHGAGQVDPTRDSARLSKRLASATANAPGDTCHAAAFLGKNGGNARQILPPSSVASGRRLTESRRPFRRQVLVNTASSGVANGWAMVVAFVSLPVLLSGLGQAAFGTWVLLSTF